MVWSPFGHQLLVLQNAGSSEAFEECRAADIGGFQHQRSADESNSCVAEIQQMLYRLIDAGGVIHLDVIDELMDATDIQEDGWDFARDH